LTSLPKFTVPEGNQFLDIVGADIVLFVSICDAVSEIKFDPLVGIVKLDPLFKVIKYPIPAKYKSFHFYELDPIIS